MKIRTSLVARLSGGVFVVLAATAALAQVLSLESSYIVPVRDPAIRYDEVGTRNAVARLRERLLTGQISLAYDRVSGYLPALLEALEIPSSSQTLVFSKTSFQAARIYPHSPRAIYFNDSVAVGYVRSGDLLELAATDPDAGVVFFTLDQNNVQRPTITRHIEECLQCHASPRTLGVPGLVVRSVVPDRSGMPISRASSFFTDHRSALEERWGGWYVTGTHGDSRHMGNQIASDEAGTIDPNAGANVTSLKRFLDPNAQLTPHSDLVALMVLEHQVRITNLITRVGWETRLALNDHASLVRLGEPAGQFSASIRRRIERPAEVLVRALIMLDEHTLSAPVKGTSGFAEHYAGRGPRDKQGRSLYELDLARRLYRYRFSPLIYSEQFAGLPEDVRSHIYRRLNEVLTGKDRSADFATITADERGAILAILRDTLAGFPPL